MRIILFYLQKDQRFALEIREKHCSFFQNDVNLKNQNIQKI